MLYFKIRACLYDPGQAGRDAYRDPARNTNSKECLYDPATYIPPRRDLGNRYRDPA